MYTKIIKNDSKKNKLITITIMVFILLAALTVNLFGAIDNMLLEAKTPHFMQMHSGEIDRNRLEAFVRTENNVESCQISEFLNIEGAEITIGDNTLAGSVQDNGLSVQNEKFDFLLDLNSNIIVPAEGEIYVPIYYSMEQKLMTESVKSP